jgi:hypothetical protein
MYETLWWGKQQHFYLVVLMMIAAVMSVAERSVPEGRTVNNLRFQPEEIGVRAAKYPGGVSQFYTILHDFQWKQVFKIVPAEYEVI